jgi:hypothetical protein
MAPQSLKEARLADCAAAKACRNPCLRCMRHYGEQFDAEDAKVCRFGNNEALYGTMTDDKGHQYRKCGYCLSNGQDCLEVGQFCSI